MKTEREIDEGCEELSRVDLSGMRDTRDDETILREMVTEKLDDIRTPGFVAEFDPDEAEMAGAFREDALSEGDALEAMFDSSDDDEGVPA